jgi:hypothetical protein
MRCRRRFDMLDACDGDLDTLMARATEPDIYESLM